MLAVVAFHLLLSCGVPDAYWLGRVGVLAFFVHTSIVLMASLERRGNEAGWVADFYMRRAWRIYPLAIATLLLVLALSIPAIGAGVGGPVAYLIPSWRSTLANLLLVQNLAGAPSIWLVMWTLPFEVQMYALLPLAYLVARRGVFGVAGLLALGIAASLLRSAHVETLPGLGLWRLGILGFVPCFIAGVLAYALLRHQRRPARLPSWAWPILLVLAGVLYRPWFERLPSWPQWAFCAVVAMGIVGIRELPVSWLTRAAKTVATYSYGCYLLHSVALWLGFVVLRTQLPAIQWAVVLVGVPLFSWLAYHAIEAPGIRAGSRLVRWMARRRTGRDAPSAAVAVS